jgi:cytochrome c
VLFIERHGYVNLYTPADGKIRRIATIPVSTKYTDSSNAEDGLLGLAADPNFATNGWLYMYFSPAGPEAKNVLARFTMIGDSLDLASKKVLLEVGTQRLKCCHTGGSIAFDAHGNLYVSTGDNSNPFATGYAPIDERPGREPWDAQKSSANTNDLRGKILRIHPEPDGSYTIPEGNLFPKGMPKTRAEIYTMGHRNPYRITVDKRTGFVYWGEVGPDADVDSVGRGPRGYDEINQARTPGNYGWPYFVANNQAYYKTTVIDSTHIEAGAQFDPAHPVNHSPNNTGLSDLPPARGAYIWYPYAPSPDFPIVGSGGRAAEAGPVFHREDFSSHAFPAYYDGKLFIYEFMRHWIMAVTMDKNGDFVSMEQFMPNSKFSAPIEMEFAPNGDMYILEYGTLWFQGNDDARLVRIEYNGGNRKPIVATAVDHPKGALPLRVALSSAGTVDLDEDSLTYDWTIARKNGQVLQHLSEPNPSFTFARPGTYTASLTVTDSHGAATTAAPLEIVAGNQPPVVDATVAAGNTTFFFPGVPVRYAVRVSDREDGTLQSGKIPARRVRVTGQYLKDSTSGGAVAQGKQLLEGSDCLSCHQLNRKSLGPAYVDVAQKYKGDTSATARLIKKIREGGSGVWGQVAMPAHPALSDEQAAAMLKYIMSLADTGGGAGAKALPVRGTYTPPAGSGDAPQGVVVVRAEYTDRGANGMPTITSEKTLVLRSPTVVVANGQMSEGVSKQTDERVPVPITVVNRSGSSVVLKQLDLAGIGAVTLSVVAPTQYQAKGGKIELHADSATGALLGATEPIQPTTDQNPSRLHVALQPKSGLHDVYFVFTNPDVKGDAFLFGVLTATFEPAARGARR